MGLFDPVGPYKVSMADIEKPTEEPQDELPDKHFRMRAPCRQCGSLYGNITLKNGQHVLHCEVETCKKYQYCVPATEKQRKVRTIATVHRAIKSYQRIRILLRALGRCELCGASPQSGALIDVGHLLSVKDGFAAGLPDVVINADENLAAMCKECNSGLGEATVPLPLMVAILRRRTQHLVAQLNETSRQKSNKSFLVGNLLPLRTLRQGYYDQDAQIVEDKEGMQWPLHQYKPEDDVATDTEDGAHTHMNPAACVHCQESFRYFEMYLGDHTWPLHLACFDAYIQKQEEDA